MEDNIFSGLTPHMYRKWGMTGEIEDQVYSLKVVACEVKFLYAKNFYKESASQQDAVLFLFEENRIRSVKFLEDGSILVETYLLSLIKKVGLQHKDRGFSILTIEFDNGDSIVLNSLSDSDHKKWDLQKMILEIYSTL